MILSWLMAGLEWTSMDACQAVPASTTEPADMLLLFAAQEINTQSSHKYFMIICMITVNSWFKKGLNFQIYLYKAFFWDVWFLDSVHKSFLNQATLDLRKESWSLLNRNLPVLICIAHETEHIFCHIKYCVHISNLVYAWLPRCRPSVWRLTLRSWPI